MIRDRDSTPQLWHAELDDITGALEALADVLSREDDFRTVLHQVCQQVTRAVPGIDWASITLVRNGTAETAATTDEGVAELDLEQYKSGLGPCLQAADTGRLVRVAVEEAMQRWPEFAAAAQVAGIGSFLSSPLVIDNEYSGAVNCYGHQNDGFRDVDAQLLELYTTAVEAALRSSRRYQQARELAEQLREALTSRAIIDQAKGIIMAARGITADDAFTLLVEQSQRDNIKLRELAERFVANITRDGW